MHVMVRVLLIFLSCLLSSVSLAEKKIDNEFGLSLNMMSAELFYKHRIADNLFLGPAIGYGSSVSLGPVDNSHLNEGRTVDTQWISLVGSYQTSKFISLTGGISFSNFKHESSNAAYDIGKSSGVYIQPEIGFADLKFGTRFSMNNYREGIKLSGTGLKWTPIVVRYSYHW